MSATEHPLTSPSTEVVSVRVEREERWCYERHVDDGLSIRHIADLATKPVDEGGLGYPMSTATVSRRWSAYRAKLAELVQDTRAERVQVSLDKMADRERRTLELAGPVDEAATAKARARAQYGGGDPNNPDLLVLRDDATRLKALAELRRIDESRRKLLGDDAPTTINANVTTTDAATAELNAMLAEAGLDPIESEGQR